jgi:hypothetical protein
MRDLLRYVRKAPPRVAGDDLGQAVAAFNAERPILDVFNGHDLKRIGKEHHGPCPLCGGDDRFCVWPARGRAWCRQCNTSGDALAWSMRLDGHDPNTPGETARYLTAQGHLRPPERPPERKPAPAPTSDTPESNLGASTRLTRDDVTSALGRIPTEAEREFLQERAAIMFMDGGLPLHDAEREALRCLVRYNGNGGFSRD